MLNLFTRRSENAAPQTNAPQIDATGAAVAVAAPPAVAVAHVSKILQRLEASVEEDPKTGHFRCRRDIFTDPELFDLEMKHIWEGNWIYLAHESQIPKNNDYFTTYIGRQPIVISRDRTGTLHAFINACSHRGAMICRHKRGNRTTYTCPFHGWTFNNTGKLLKAKDPEGAGYPETFNKRNVISTGLPSVPWAAPACAISATPHHRQHSPK